MAKKAVSKSHKNHETNLKAFIALLVLAIALGIFFIFNTYRDNIMDPSKVQTFVILTLVLGGFLVGLLYLLNPKR